MLIWSMNRLLRGEGKVAMSGKLINELGYDIEYQSTVDTDCLQQIILTVVKCFFL